MPFAKSVWHDKSLNHLPFSKKKQVSLERDGCLLQQKYKK